MHLPSTRGTPPWSLFPPMHPPWSVHSESLNGFVARNARWIAHRSFRWSSASLDFGRFTSRKRPFAPATKASAAAFAASTTALSASFRGSSSSFLDRSSARRAVNFAAAGPGREAASAASCGCNWRRRDDEGVRETLVELKHAAEAVKVSELVELAELELAVPCVGLGPGRYCTVQLDRLFPLSGPPHPTAQLQVVPVVLAEYAHIGGLPCHAMAGMPGVAAIVAELQPIQSPFRESMHRNDRPLIADSTVPSPPFQFE